MGGDDDNVCVSMIQIKMTSLDLISIPQAMTHVNPTVKCYTRPEGQNPVYAILTVNADGTVYVVGQDKSGGLKVTDTKDITSHLQNHGWFHPKLTPQALDKPVPYIDLPASVLCTNATLSLRVVLGTSDLSGGWCFNGSNYVGEPFDSFLKQHGWATCQDFNIPYYALGPCCKGRPPVNPPSLPSLTLPGLDITLTYQGTPGRLQTTLVPQILSPKPVVWGLTVEFIPDSGKPAVLASTVGPATEDKFLSTRDPENPEVTNGGLPVTYYAAWNGVDTFILAYVFPGNQTKTSSESGEKIKKFLDQVAAAEAIPTHFVPPPPKQPSCSLSKKGVIGLAVAAGILLVLVIVLIVLLGKSKRQQ
jgi:hypothetical protein